MPTPAPRLLVTDATGRRLVAIDKEVVTIGRRSETDICLPAPGVSRLHAAIVLRAGTYVLHDRESKLGTFVNGTRVAEHPLAHGDRIALGQPDEPQITFLIHEGASTVERSATSAANEMRHLARLLEGLRALGSGRVLDEVLALVLDSAIEVTGAERGFIMLAGENGALEFKLARGRGRLPLTGSSFATSRKIPESVFASGQAMVVEDLQDEGHAALHMGTVALGIRCVLCTPLRLVRYVEKAEERADENVIGVLYVDSRDRAALLSDSTHVALETLSREAAIAIENARLYRQAIERARDERELKVAADVQQALLPRGDRTGTFFRIAGASVTCRAIGGDFFDYVDRPDGQFGFILGDVAGKGPAAALLASASLGMFSAEASYHNGASIVASRLNAGIVRRGIEGRFVTAFYALLTPEGQLTYSNAGHNAPVLLTKEGARRLETGGMVLGLFEHAPFDEETVTLSAGDTLVVFSDGVTEAVDASGEEFGDERLLACLASHRGSAPTDVLQAVMAAVRVFSRGTPQSDDVTVVALRFDGTRG